MRTRKVIIPPVPCNRRRRRKNPKVGDKSSGLHPLCPRPPRHRALPCVKMFRTVLWYAGGGHNFAFPVILSESNGELCQNAIK